MGTIVKFSSNGGQASGYLAIPEKGTGPGVVVIQEWWGLVDHIKDVCDRFAENGYVALAPDLYNGKTTDQPGEAQQLMEDLKVRGLVLGCTYPEPDAEVTVDGLRQPRRRSRG